MDAYKCDRCGRYYDENRPWSKETLYLKRHKDGGILDLCENCNDSLTKWFNKYAEHEQKKKG